jgi:DNA-binding beta-propeller fold protein YncE
VYCGDGDAGVLVVIDAVGDSVIRTITGFPYPTSLGYNYLDNKVYCGDYGDGNIFVLDGAADTVIARLYVGNEPTAFCFVPTSDMMCCATSGYPEAVVVIDGRYNSTRATTQVGVRPVAMTYNGIQNRLYTANNFDASVTVLDGNTWDTVGTVATGLGPVAIGFDSVADKVYCLNGARSVTVIDARVDSVIETIGVGPGPSAMAWNPAHRRFYVANRDSSCISVLKDTAVVGVADRPRGLQTRVQATMVRGVLFLPGDPGSKPQATAFLLDISGRRVLDLRPGDNDVRRLPAGVYFVRQFASNATTKVVVER